MGFADRLSKRRHFDRLVVIFCIRWYVKYKLRYRDLVEMTSEQGLMHCLPHAHMLGDLFYPGVRKTMHNYSKPVVRPRRVDKTYSEVKGQWDYFCRAVDKEGRTVDS
jgi:transposase-like protein